MMPQNLPKIYDENGEDYEPFEVSSEIEDEDEDVDNLSALERII